MIWTSSSRVILNFDWTRFLASLAKARTSFWVAGDFCVPMFWKKFACLSEIFAWPSWWPLRPHWSMR